MMFAIVGVLIMVIMLIMITSLSRIKKKTTVRIEEGEDGAKGVGRSSTLHYRMNLIKEDKEF